MNTEDSGEVLKEIGRIAVFTNYSNYEKLERIKDLLQAHEKEVKND
jgi:hypothetical protein